ncbi:hypothetical protein IWZ03DRAFT_386630 [Phyllosticta citriasiana]|uniref:Secreted protein n=1 Tax=Phyllosticta citriasiana TaxID=595635 RepID=A0ABR1KDU4_9PEZI
MLACLLACLIPAVLTEEGAASSSVAERANDEMDWATGLGSWHRDTSNARRTRGDEMRRSTRTQACEAKKLVSSKVPIF